VTQESFLRHLSLYTYVLAHVGGYDRPIVPVDRIQQFVGTACSTEVRVALAIGLKAYAFIRRARTASTFARTSAPFAGAVGGTGAGLLTSDVVTDTFA
jgi:hypothetical protein